jgi:hypothetical protein
MKMCVQFEADINRLLREFRNRLADFVSSEKDIQLFADPFIFEASIAPETMQLELIELQSNQLLRSKHREFGHIRSHALRLMSLFGSTCFCKQTFSQMKLNKSQLRSRLTDCNLENILRLTTANFEPQTDKIMKKKQCNKSH